MNGEPHEVVGVLPADFRFPRISRLYSIPIDAERPDLWKPLAMTENDPLSGLNFAAIGRLSSGATIQQAQSELDALQPTIVPSSAPGGGNATIPGELVPLQEQITGASRRGLEVLLAAVAAVLLIACVNVTNLILSRSVARGRELAVRSAVGATRGRLMRQLFTEGAVLSLAGGVVGLAMAMVALRLLVVTAPVDMPRLDEVRIDADVLPFAALITMAAALIVGLLPAWRLPRLSLHDVLKQSSAHSHAAEGARSHLTQSALVVGQVCATAVCAIVAGLLFQSFLRVLAVDKGFETANIVTADLELAGPAIVGRRLPFQRSTGRASRGAARCDGRGSLEPAVAHGHRDESASARRRHNGSGSRTSAREPPHGQRRLLPHVRHRDSGRPGLQRHGHTARGGRVGIDRGAVVARRERCWQALSSRAGQLASDRGRRCGRRRSGIEARAASGADRLRAVLAGPRRTGLVLRQDLGPLSVKTPADVSDRHVRFQTGCSRSSIRRFLLPRSGR